MNLTNVITTKLNQLESFANGASWYWLPLRLLAWIVLLAALIFTNMVALVRWPFSFAARLISNKQASNNAIVEAASQEELDALLAKHDKVLVDFWAEWCGPCLLMNSAIKMVAEQYANEVLVVKVDASLNTSLSKSYGVRGLPTLILFGHGEELTRKSGALTINQLTSFIELADN